MVKRIVWIDYAKALAIFGVVLLHLHVTEEIRNFLLIWINGFFFLISGYLYKRINAVSELKKTLQSVLIPMLIFIVIISILYTLKGNPQKEYFTSLATLNFTSLVGVFAPVCPLWFLVTLSFLRLLSTNKALTPPC